LLSDAVSAALGSSVEGVQLVAPEELAGAGTVLVLDRSPVEPLDERVRAAAYTTLPAPLIRSDVFRQRPPPQPILGWIGAGAGFAFVALSLACLVSVVDRILAVRDRHRLLVNVGGSPRMLAGLSATLFAVPFAVVSAVGLGAGIVIAAWQVQGESRMPWSFIGWTCFGVVVAGTVGTLAVTGLGARSARRDPK
jgi:hypothetical protein